MFSLIFLLVKLPVSYFRKMRHLLMAYNHGDFPNVQQQLMEVPKEHHIRNNNELYKGDFRQYGSRCKLKF